MTFYFNWGIKLGYISDGQVLKTFFFRGSPCGCMIGYLHCIEGVHGSFVKHLLGKGYSMIFCLK